MTRAITMLLAVALLGCVAEAGPEPPWPTRSLALEMWGGPVGECESAQLNVSYLERPDFERLCFIEEDETAEGCFVPPGTIRILEVRRRSRRLLAHELGHWLFWCSGLGAGDENHDDPLFIDAVEGMVGS